MSENWASGAVYEPYIGRWSRPVAREFLAWLDIPAQSRWLDVGCGTGAISQMILQNASPSQVKGIDQSEGFIHFARQQVSDVRVSFEVGDAQALSEPSAGYDAAISGLVLNFVPAKEKMVAEMARVTRSGGTVAVYVWDYADKMQMLRYFWDAAIAIDPRGNEVDEGSRFPICKPEPLAELFRSTGLQAVETRAIDIPMAFTSFDDFWTPFLSGQGPAPHYAMSLSEADRAALREHLRSKLPIQADGSIPLIARVWAVRGTVG